MKNTLKFVIIFIFIILSGIVYSQNRATSTGKESSNKIDSLVINTVNNYNNEIVKNDRKAIITAKIREISKDDIDITISYILNDFDLYNFKPLYVFYINNKTCVIVKADSNVINNYKGNISFKKMTIVLANKIKAQLNNSQTRILFYEPVYWILSYKNGSINITKDLLILPPGY